MRLGFLLVFVCSVGLAQTDLRGLEWEDDAYRQMPFKPSYFVPAIDQPSSFSLKAYCPRIINQAQTNNGVAWAAVWYARTIAQAVESGWTDQASITKNAFSPGFNYKPNSRGGCDAPVRLSSVLSSLQSDGALPFSSYKEMCEPDSIAPELASLAKKNKLPGFVHLFNMSDPKEIKIRTIKEALIVGHPVVIGMICPPSFSLAQAFWQPREDPDKAFGGHAVCIVGYDDSAYGGAFEIVNSWGRQWAQQGFTQLRYDDVSKFVLYGYELINTPAKSGEGLSAAVSMTLSNGTPMTAKFKTDGFYRLAKTWPTGTQFQIKTEFNTDLFFYAVAFDEKRNHEVLFPPEKGVYPWIQKKNGPVILPDPSHSVTLTEPAGKNYILLVFSGRDMKPSEMISQLKEGSGDFGQSLLTRKSVTKQTWSPDAISMTAEWSSDTLVTLIIQIDQVH